MIGETGPAGGSCSPATPRPCQDGRGHAHDADLLVHEATFTRGRARARAGDRALDGAARRPSSPADADVKLLALTHLSTRYFPREIRDEARAGFENTVVPRDFDAIEVPFPEQGEPRLIKAQDALEPDAAG